MAEGHGTQKYVDPVSCRDRAEDRHFLCRQRGCQVSTTLIRHRRTHSAIPNPSESQAAMLLLPSSRTALSLPFPPKRLLHQNPLLSPQKSHTVGISSWCLTGELGCEGSPAKHPQGMGSSSSCRPSIPGARQGRGLCSGGKAQHGPVFLSKCLFSFCFNQETA